METKRHFRIVLASLSDVQAERDAAVSVIDSVNQILRGLDLPAALDLVRWETDAHPGMHTGGPQGLIDEGLRIEDSDALIGVFWKRFGTPVSDADSGTEHEIRRAIESWGAKKSPQVMLYFRDTPYQPTSPAEQQQYQKVQAFRQDLISKDKLLVWNYRDVTAFSDQLQKHLLNVVTQQLKPRTRAAGPLSYLRVSASANTVCARYEGAAEPMGDVFLRCTYDHDIPLRGPVRLTVTLSASLPINSSGVADRVSDVVLFEVGRPGVTTLVRGLRAESPGANTFLDSILTTCAQVKPVSFKSATFAAIVAASELPVKARVPYSSTS